MIGVFDSGFGGLTILKYFLKDLPKYDFLYLGDSARSPYGGRSQENIYKYTKEAVEFLFKQGCEIIIIACNSASAQALRKIQREYLPKEFSGKKVLGVIRPLLEKISEKNQIKRVGVLATKATVESGAYFREIRKINPNLEIIQQAAPLLVPLIEEGWLKERETKMILKKYLRPLKVKQPEALLLACTHYSFLLEDIRRIMGKRCLVEDPGKIISDSLVEYLNNHPEIDKKLGKNSQRKFFTTGSVENFKRYGEKFLQFEIKNLEKIIL